MEEGDKEVIDWQFYNCREVWKCNRFSENVSFVCQKHVSWSSKKYHCLLFSYKDIKKLDYILRYKNSTKYSIL